MSVQGPTARVSGATGPGLYVVSDATADTAERVLRSALVQYPDVRPDVRIFSLVRSRTRVGAIVSDAAQAGALIVFTMVQPELREALEQAAEQADVPAIDLIGGVVQRLSSFLGQAPSGRPGLPRLGADYFKRIEAVEFTIQHDDGQSLRTVHEADIVLVGLSRTSKTPLSTFLAHKGYKVANVPLVLGLPMPRELDESVESWRVFGLIIDVGSLIRIRRARLRSMNAPMDSDYARRDHVVRELHYARELFDKHPEWPVIDVSQKAVEETAAIVLRAWDERRRARQQAGRSAGAAEAPR